MSYNFSITLNSITVLLITSKVSFKITKTDYVAVYKSNNDESSSGNCVASDFRNALLSELMSDLDTIKGLPVVHIQKKKHLHPRAGGTRGRRRDLYLM